MKRKAMVSGKPMCTRLHNVAIYIDLDIQFYVIFFYRNIVSVANFITKK